MGCSAGAATVVALGLIREDDYKSELTLEEDPTLGERSGHSMLLAGGGSWR